MVVPHNSIRIQTHCDTMSHHCSFFKSITGEKGQARLADLHVFSIKEGITLSYPTNISLGCDHCIVFFVLINCLQSVPNILVYQNYGAFVKLHGMY